MGPLVSRWHFPAAAVVGLILGASGFAASDVLPDLHVSDLEGRPVRVFTGDARDIVVLFFVAPECPVSNRSLPAMQALATEFGSPRVRFLGLYPEPDAPLETLRRHAADFRINFPLATDRRQALVAHTGVTVTPEAVIADGRGTLLYRGRIDDRFVGFGQERAQPTREEVREILSALRRGERPAFRTAAGFGCQISRPVPKP